MRAEAAACQWSLRPKIHGARVSIVAECYTSQGCSQCQHFLNKFCVGEDDVWALKRCTHCKSSRGTDLIWNRDRNASLNSMSIYMASTSWASSMLAEMTFGP